MQASQPSEDDPRPDAAGDLGSDDSATPSKWQEVRLRAEPFPAFFQLWSRPLPTQFKDFTPTPESTVRSGCGARPGFPSGLRTVLAQRQ